MRIVLVILLLLAPAVALGQTAESASPSAGSEAKSKTGRPRPAIAVTPEREAAVFAFVERNHTELKDLLNLLKEGNDRRAYQRAVRELFLASERLASLQENDAERYEVELRLWKAKSRIQLVSARLTMGSNERFVSELKSALAEQHGARRDQLRLEQRRASDRLRKVEENLAEHESRREAMIERQLRAITAGAESSAKARTSPVNAKAANRE